MKIRFAAVALLIVSLVGCASAPDTEGVTRTFEGFYAAMKAGNAADAMKFIAPDAVFIESGRLETRQQYEESHLPADIEFEAQVTGVRSPLDIKIDGDTAWVIATSEYHGEFDGDPVDFISAQLMVLARQDGEWKIRSVHWSSRRA